MAFSIIQVSRPKPNSECWFPSGKQFCTSIEIIVADGTNIYRITIPAWNVETEEPWTKETLREHLISNKDFYAGYVIEDKQSHYVGKAEILADPDLELFEGINITDVVLKAFVKLFIDELNIVRGALGLVPRSMEQFLAAMRSKLEE